MTSTLLPDRSAPPLLSGLAPPQHPDVRRRARRLFVSSALALFAVSCQPEQEFLEEQYLSRAGVSATLFVQSDWGVGYCTNVNITNGSGVATKSWSVVVMLKGATISQSWNATLAQTAEAATFTPVSWNAALNPGAATSFGFCAARKAGKELPLLSSLLIDGVAVPSGTGGAPGTGGTTASGGRDGMGSGGLATGGLSSSGGATGGAFVATGGSTPTGGALTGGATTGGALTGGRAMGGAMVATGGLATGGVATGGLATGGRATGGAATGGLATGGLATGGVATGGLATGGAATGGLATGGAATGGIKATGGLATGGVATGGLATGGAATGGIKATGGLATGGVATGGLATGGVATGGLATGGAATGGIKATGGLATGGLATGGLATGGAGTGGTTGSCNMGTVHSGGKQYCSNSIGSAGNGYSYQLWSNGVGTGCMTVFGADATFKANWSNAGDFLARVGLGWDSTKTYDQLGTIAADLAFNKSISGGQGYVGIYGWSVNPLVEYYIIEDWVGSRPTWNATKVGTFTLDGEGTYDVYTHTQINQPAITGGNATFLQLFSIRTTQRQCGHVSITEHFKQWASMGQTLGKMEEARILVESMNNSGSIEFTTATVTAR